ncbi:MAG: HDOD domain-containing protein [Bacteroidetes bacterium]|nr:HDOD domain-containing protein [Bacteroidota bacterium]
MSEYLKMDSTKAEVTVKRLQNISQLPAIPKVITEVSKLFSNPNTSITQLSDIIEKDQALTLKVLSVANSPLYGIQREINSLHAAILILGFQELRSIVTALGMKLSFKTTSSEYFDFHEFWLHSMVVGIAAKRITKELGFHFDGDSFTAGILHDFGLLVLHEYLQDSYEKILLHATENNMDILEAEYEILGLSHQEIGNFLAKKWSLTSTLNDSLTFHHRPADSVKNNYLTSIIHIADYATQKLQIGNFFWDNNYKLDSSVLSLLNFVTREEFEDFIEAYREDFALTASTVKL